MRAVTIFSFGKVAIMTKHPKAGRVVVAAQPSVDVFNFCSVFSTTAINMVNRKKLKERFVTASASIRSAAVMLNYLRAYLNRIRSLLRLEFWGLPTALNVF